jgi:hypothetical protein
MTTITTIQPDVHSLKALISVYYDMQKLRIATQLREIKLHSNILGKAVNALNKHEKEVLETVAYSIKKKTIYRDELDNILDEDSSVIIKGACTFLNNTHKEDDFTTDTIDNLEKDVINSLGKIVDKLKPTLKETVLTEPVTFMKKEEDVILKQIKPYVHNSVIYDKWMRGIKGVGPILAGSLIATIGDVKRFDNISKLWAYSGLSVKDGKAVRLKAGQQANWNSFLKMTCWKLGESFVKTHGFYNKLYKEFKEEYSKREDLKQGKGYKGHIHAMAKRKAVKIFLSHLWLKWRQLEGLPVTKPYSFQVLNHSEEHMIPIPEKD